MMLVGEFLEKYGKMWGNGTKIGGKMWGNGAEIGGKMWKSR